MSEIEAVRRGQSFLDSLAEQMAVGNHIAIKSGNAPACNSDATTWPDPQPLAAKVDPEPYPLDALPLPIRAAVEEVAGFVKAPVPMVHDEIPVLVVAVVKLMKSVEGFGAVVGGRVCRMQLIAQAAIVGNLGAHRWNGFHFEQLFIYLGLAGIRRDADGGPQPCQLALALIYIRRLDLSEGIIEYPINLAAALEWFALLIQAKKFAHAPVVAANQSVDAEIKFLGFAQLK